jgi:hypothetical protein
MMLEAWERALARSGLPLCGLDTPSGTPRFAFAAPLSPSVPGDAELADLWLSERAERWRVRQALAAVLPAEWTLADLYDIWLGEPALPGRVVASVFRVRLVASETSRSMSLRQAAAALLAAPSLPRQRPKGEATVAYDLRPLLGAIEVTATLDGLVVRLTLRHDPEKGIGRPEEALTALAQAQGGPPLAIRDVTRERLVLADPPTLTAPLARSSPGNLRGRRGASRR